MKRKLFIGSIIAVAVLIGVSFTSVVGYRTVDSNVKESPLFNIRTNRAIGEEDKILTSNYFGKVNTLPFPKRDDKAIMVQKVVESIKKTDDKTFKILVVNIIDYARKDNRFNGVKPDEIREALYLVRDSYESIPFFDANREIKYFAGPTTPTSCTCFFCDITFGYGLKGFLGCIFALPNLIMLFITAYICTLFCR